MRLVGFLGSCLLAGALTWASPMSGVAHAEDQASSLRNGEHDFDFNFGRWRTEITRVLNPLDGGTERTTMVGTVTVREVWGGKAQLEEIEASGPKGHFQGTTLFLYDPTAHQWSQTFASSSGGGLNKPTIGEFKDGRGELFATDIVKGRNVLLRGVWSDIKPDSHTYEEDLSDDGGRTWKPAFVAHLTRIKS